ncbi:MAG: putative metallopeptidase [Candidatus Diapherotrites archaeon]
MKYIYSEKWTQKTRELAEELGFSHINPDRVCCIESSGSKTRRIIARIHSLGKAMQLGMNCDAFYVIELLSKNFDKESDEDKVKTLIHELLHIPQSFGGGFRHHRPYVNRGIVEGHYKRLMESPSPTYL